MNFDNIELPKWPQMIVSGHSVIQEQAEDIIFRTDWFLSSTSEYSGGNNEEFNNWYREISGLNKFREKLIKNNIDIFDGADFLRNKINFVETQYVHNSWASCSYVFGAYGWCHPDGNIGYIDNIGKHPTISEVVKDWNLLLNAFPYLNLNITLMSGECSEENTFPIINIRLKDKVELLKPNLAIHNLRQFSRGHDDFETFFKNRNETALTQELVKRYSIKIKEAIHCVEIDLGIV